MHRVGWVPSVWRDYTKCIALGLVTGTDYFEEEWGGGGGGGGACNSSHNFLFSLKNSNAGLFSTHFHNET